MAKTLDLDLQVARYLDTKLNLYSHIKMGQPSQNGNSISYIMQPLQKVQNYYNGRKKRTFAFAMQSKHTSWQTAVESLNQINAAMEHANKFSIKSSNGTFLFVNADMTLTPQYVGLVTDSKEANATEYAIYQATFNVTALINI